MMQSTALEESVSLYIASTRIRNPLYAQYTPGGGKSLM